jgi:hypothetical protein
VRRPPLFGLLAITLFLALFPLVPVKPGLPPNLKADEPAYYLMALSLAHDGDLRLETRDVERASREYPYGKVGNVIVMTDDGWRTVYFSKPYLYSLFAAPFARLFGANGLVFFNMLLLLAMVWMGAFQLARFNPGGIAVLFAAGYFLLSCGFAYVFWLHPEVFNMAAVAAAFFLCWYRTGEGEGVEPATWRIALSGAALSLAVYNKPMLAALALPLVADLLRRRRWRAALVWAAGAALSLAAVAGLAAALTGHPTPYLGVERQGVVICQPDKMPISPDPAGEGGSAFSRSPTGGSWSWIFHLPTILWRELAENLGYFLWGRHTGLFWYMPFAALAALYFLLHERRSLRGWLLLVALAGIALSFLVFISHNWQGGGGFVGNRYFVNAYPAFLFLVTRLTPRWPTAAGYAAGGLLLGPMLFSPFGYVVPEPTLQAHVRNWPFPRFPLELSLRELPGYRKVPLGDRTFQGRADVFLPMGEEMWLGGATRAEVIITGLEPLAEAVFLVRDWAPGNTVELRMGGAEETLSFGAVPDGGELRRIALRPGRPWKVLSRDGTRVYVDRLLVTSRTGRVRPWVRNMPPDDCPYFAYNPSFQESFFAGAGLIYLGRGAELARDVYALSWGPIAAPAAVRAGEVFTLPVHLANRSDAVWSAAGAARVKLAYHWLTPEGEVVVWEGRRTEIELPVPPGGRVAAAQEIEAPAAPGRYLLELDPVFEHVAWFSKRDPATTFRAAVEVLPAAGGTGGEGGEGAAGVTRVGEGGEAAAGGRGGS